MTSIMMRLCLAAALVGAAAVPCAAQEKEIDRFEKECGAAEAKADEHGGDKSLFSDKCIPLARIPQRPRPVIELGTPFLGTGIIRKGITMPGGAVWQPSLMAFATSRSAVQGFRNDSDESQLVEAVTRLDLFGNLYLTQTERVVIGFRPLDRDGRFTTRTLSGTPDGRFAPDSSVLNFTPSTLFFEGDIAELLPNLDKKDRRSLDYYISVGRQPLSFQDGALVNEDQMDMLGLTKANLKIGKLINTRITGVWGWGQITRHGATRNVTDASASLFGLFSEIDTRRSTIQLDAVYVQGSDSTGSGLHFGASDTRRIGGRSNTFRVMGSMPVGEEYDFNSSGLLIQNQIGWTPHHSDNWVYVTGFAGIGKFRSAARGQPNGGPGGPTGVLFAAPGIGRLGAPLGNQVDDAVGGAIGYQMFFSETRKQLLLELGGRASIQDSGPGTNQLGAGATFQAAVMRRWVLVFQGIGSYNTDSRQSLFGARTELQLRM
jgi:hypothetical protein